MSIDYSATVAYGVAIKSDKYTDEDEAREWLRENNYEHIEWESCGDWMSGEFVDLFYIPRTYSHIDWKFEGGFISFDTPVIKLKESQDLGLICRQHGLGYGAIGWKLVFNVS